LRAVGGRQGTLAGTERAEGTSNFCMADTKFSIRLTLADNK
jgi:hypothetical protein